MGSPMMTPQEQTLQMFKALSHPLGWKIIVLLMAWGEQQVLELETKLSKEGLPPGSEIDRQMGMLRAAGLVNRIHKDKDTYYGLSEIWDCTEDSISLLVGGKVGVEIKRQPWVSTS